VSGLLEEALVEGRALVVAGGERVVAGGRDRQRQADPAPPAARQRGPDVVREAASRDSAPQGRRCADTPTEMSSRRPLRVATILAPCNRPLYAHVARRLGQPLESRVELETVGYDSFRAGEVDVGFICGLPYVWLSEAEPELYEPLAAPVLRGSRYGGRPVYFSDVIVRRGRPWRSLADLAGLSWGFNEPASHSGYGVVAFTLAERGLGWGHFGRTVQVGCHARAIEMVADGRLDAAAIDSQVLAFEQRRRPALRHALRTIESLGPSSIQPVVASPRRAAAPRRHADARRPRRRPRRPQPARPPRGRALRRGRGRRL
jgi:phosphonate transport system substrate-binding protein